MSTDSDGGSADHGAPQQITPPDVHVPTTEEDAMPPRPRSGSTGSDDALTPSTLEAPHPGFAADLEVESRAPQHYMRHKRTGTVQAAGPGERLELSQSGWEPCDAPEGAPAATGGPAI